MKRIIAGFLLGITSVVAYNVIAATTLPAPAVKSRTITQTEPYKACFNFAENKVVVDVRGWDGANYDLATQSRINIDNSVDPPVVTLDGFVTDTTGDTSCSFSKAAVDNIMNAIKTRADTANDTCYATN